ncbi:MAG: hypothetical protein Kow0010_19900 [Dehalococcoidia bacterium]
MSEDSSTDSIRWDIPAGIELRIDLPQRAMEHLRRVAEERGTTCEALARLYVGRGLREDLRRLFEEQVLDAAEGVLAQRLGSVEEARDIVDEVRERFRP